MEIQAIGFNPHFPRHFDRGAAADHRIGEDLRSKPLEYPLVGVTAEFGKNSTLRFFDVA
jgi:hypothetical protein